ncbi:MAG: energy transducer TonB [Bacteroidetes bacterium]|nr:energy transducer TonB [Bacteroidota bacterium]
MKTATIFLSFLVWILLPSEAISQSYKAPSPVMTKKLLKDFIQAHLVYPEKAKSNLTEGEVLIKYSLDEKGHVTKRWVAKHVAPEIDSAALHLFDLILWNPATLYGKAVESQGEFEINYRLKKYQKYLKSRGYEQISHDAYPVDTSNIIYGRTQLDVLPEPLIEERYDGLEGFISNEMNYPEEAQRLGIKGSVKLSFIIEVNGIPSNIYVEETVGGGCCEESLRILQLIKWTPGIKDETYVRTSYELTIHFNTAGDHRSIYIPNQSNSGL